MLKISGATIVKCDKCQTGNTIAESDFEMDSGGGSERGMGPETETFVSSTIPCSKCRQEISVEYQVSIYPVGVINHVNSDITGGVFVQESQFVIEESEL